MTPNLFEWLVNYYLEQCLPYIQDDKIHDREGKPLIEGSGQPAPHNGVLIIAGGGTLVDKLKADEVIKLMKDEVIIVDEAAFHLYLREHEGRDREYIFDSTRRKITPVGVRNYDLPLQDIPPLSDMVPQDFFSYMRPVARGKALRRGKALKFAIEIPHAYKHTDTYLIDRSPYANLGMGQLTHFTNQGLSKRLFFMHDPESKGPFVNPDKCIVGVYRTYKRGNNGSGLKMDSERLIDGDNGIPHNHYSLSFLFTSTKNTLSKSIADRIPYLRT